MKGDGYEKRFGASWQVELKKAVDQNWCDVTEIMDHYLQWMTDIFRGTLHEHTCCFYHDGLSQWYAAEAQEHMRRSGPHYTLARSSLGVIPTRMIRITLEESLEIARRWHED